MIEKIISHGKPSKIFGGQKPSAGAAMRELLD